MYSIRIIIYFCHMAAFTCFSWHKRSVCVCVCVFFEKSIINYWCARVFPCASLNGRANILFWPNIKWRNSRPPTKKDLNSCTVYTVKSCRICDQCVSFYQCNLLYLNKTWFFSTFFLGFTIESYFKPKLFPKTFCFGYS